MTIARRIFCIFDFSDAAVSFFLGQVHLDAVASSTLSGCWQPHADRIGSSGTSSGCYEMV